MKKMTRHVLPLLLALAMILSYGDPAFAQAGATDSPAQTAFSEASAQESSKALEMEDLDEAFQRLRSQMPGLPMPAFDRLYRQMPSWEQIRNTYKKEK